MVQAGSRLLSGTSGGYDVVRVAVDGRRVTMALGAACPPIRARTRGTRVVATWPAGRCDVAGRVTLKAAIDDGCEVLRGRVRSRGRAVAVVAPRCGADGVVSATAGEQCAGADACGPDRGCVDCRCVPLVDFTRDVQPVFRNCLTLACHEGPRATGRFELTPERAFAAVLGGVASSGPCAGARLVVPGDPDRSVLVARVSGGACGPRMPLGSTLLPAPDVDTLRAWVAQGARPD